MKRGFPNKQTKGKNTDVMRNLRRDKAVTEGLQMTMWCHSESKTLLVGTVVVLAPSSQSLCEPW